MWLDTNGCAETMHIFERVDGKIVCRHSDNSECQEAEYNFAEESEAA